MWRIATKFKVGSGRSVSGERLCTDASWKLLPEWSRRVPANTPQSGIDIPPEDGYAWRKDGQKDIFAAKYPRSYYRCTYKNDMGCKAKKHVQKAEDDPSFFDVNYRDLHSCHIDRRLLQIAAPSSMPQIGSQRDSAIPNALFFATDRNLPSETSGVHRLSAAQFNLSSNQPSAPGFGTDSRGCSKMENEDSGGFGKNSRPSPFAYPFDFFSSRPDEGSSASSARQPNV